jgi:hypothetical protein
MTLGRSRLTFISVDPKWTPKQKATRQGQWLFAKNTSNKASLGAGEGIRTLDPDLGKVVLYH